MHGKTSTGILWLRFSRNELAKACMRTVINFIFLKNKKKTWKSLTLFDNLCIHMFQILLYLSWPLLETPININFREKKLLSAYPEKEISYLISLKIIMLVVLFLVVSNINASKENQLTLHLINAAWNYFYFKCNLI